MTKSTLTGVAAILALAVSLAGCTDSAAPVAETDVVVDDHAGHDHGPGEHDDSEHAGHDHSGWWCPEHGVPEEECALCDTSLVADFKAAGDWCEEHNRPESQCFLCEPSRFETFAARYEAKYGEEPPQPTE